MIRVSTVCSCSVVGAEDGSAVREPIDAIEQQTMEVNIEIGRGAKALDEGDGAGAGLSFRQPSLQPVNRGPNDGN